MMESPRFSPMDPCDIQVFISISFCGFSVKSVVPVLLTCFSLRFPELNEKEPSMSTILTSFENSFDPYDALSTPLYQTATFKQVYIFSSHGFMYQKS